MNKDATHANTHRGYDMMKRVSLVALLLMVMVPVALAQVHFTPVDPTGIWSTIIIDDAVWDEVTLVEGDEIGVFDGDLCVGAVAIEAGQTWPVSVNAIGADDANGLLGYTDNNPMTFLLWKDADELERTAIVSYEMGNGRFGYDPYTHITEVLVSTTGVVFGLQLPVHNGVEEQELVELMWDEASPLEPATSLTYDVYLETGEFDSADVADGVVSPWLTGLPQDCTLVNWDGTDDTDYWWTVVAEDNFGNRSQASEIRMFEIYIPENPAGFDLLTPEQPATVADYDTVLTWEASSDPDPGDELSYWVWWATNGAFTLNLDSAEVTGTTTYEILDLLDDQTYHWKVRAQDTNTEGTWSNQTWQFDVYVIEPPDPFTLISPLSATDTCWTGDTTLTWNATTEPDPDDQVNSYMVWWATNAVFTQNLDSTEVTAGTTLDMTDLLDDHTYYWKVRATDDNTNGTWSSNNGAFHVYIPEAPNAFSLSSPDDGDTTFVDYQAVSWTASSDNDPNGWFVYEVQWSTTSGFTSFDSYQTSSTSYTIEDLPALFMGELDELPQDTTLYWRVKAVDHLGLTTWATPEAGRQFRVYFIEPPAAFDLVGPLSEGGMDTCFTGDTTLVWDATTEPDPDDQIEGYRVWWATDDGYSENLDSTFVTDGTEYDMTDLLDDHTYYWKVRAVDNNTDGTWSNQEGMFHVYIPEAPNDFELLSPVDGDTTFGGDQTVTWSATTDPDPNNAFTFELQWSTASDFTDYISYETTDTTYLIEDIEEVLLNGELDELPQDTTIYWRVKATDTYDLTTWATPEAGWEFRVYFVDPPEPFSLVAPEDGVTCWTGDTTLVWHTAEEIDPDDEVHSYMVYYATDVNFGQNLETVIVEAPDTTLDISDLYDDRTYYWKVRARDNNTNGTYSTEVFTFDTYIPESPDSFALTAPANEAHVTTGDSIRLHWEVAEDPDPDPDEVFYEVEWSLDPDFPEEDTWSWVTQANSYRINGLRPDFDDETVYWRVHCWDQFGFELWSDAGEDGWSFTVHVAQNPEPFSLTTPADSAVLDEQPYTFEWEEAVEHDFGDSVIYHVYIAGDSSFTDPMEFVTEETEVDIDTLDDDSRYWWNVHAMDTNTGGVWSNETFTFFTDFPDPPSPFTLLTPGDGDTLTLEAADTVFFSWEESMDPDPEEFVHYLGELTVSGDDHNGNPVEFSVTVDSLLENSLYFAFNDTAEQHFWWFDYIQCDWSIYAISSGDTVMCDSAFVFYVEPQTLADENPFSGLPTEYSIAAIYPNPFNPTTTIMVGLPEAADLKVAVYNVLGRQVQTLANGAFQAGYQQFVFDAKNLSSGLYFVRAVSPGKMNQLRKVMLVR